MNKFERQDSADQTTLPDDFARELSHITTEVIEVSDAPSLAPRAPLTLPGWPGYHWYRVPRVGFPDPATFRAAFGELASFHDELWRRTGISPATNPDNRRRSPDLVELRRFPSRQAASN